MPEEESDEQPEIIDELKECRADFDDGGKLRSVEVKSDDIVAIAIVMLAIGAVVVAVLMTIGVLMELVSGKTATPIILGCVGTAGIAGVVGHLRRHSKNR